MTESQNFDACVELHNNLENHEALEGQFKRLTQDCNLSSAEEDALINQYKVLMEGIEALHAQVITAYLDEIIAARAL